MSPGFRTRSVRASFTAVALLACCLVAIAVASTGALPTGADAGSPDAGQLPRDPGGAGAGGLHLQTDRAPVAHLPGPVDAGSVAGEPGGSGGAPVQTRDDAAIRLDQTLELTPARAGSVDARLRYRLPDALASLEVTVPADAAVVAAEGFERSGSATWSWDGETEEPSLRLRVRANRTLDRDDPLSAPGEYLFVDAGEWAVVRRPSIGHTWRWTGAGRIGLEETLSAEPGEAGDVIAYLGEYESYTATANGQRFRLIVPETADLAESPEAILDEFAYASDALRVGDRDHEVVAVAAPTGEVRWGVRGLQTGPADLWVRDSERLADADSVWLHEYVHTRQDWTAGPGAGWVTEASASYYAALLALERGRIDLGAFRNRVAIRDSGEFDRVRLSDPSTWRNAPDYRVGPLVVGDLDRRVRLGTGAERTFQDAFRRLNAEGEIDAATVRTAVGEVGGSDLGRLAEAYAETTRRPELWTREDHEAAFGRLPARIGYRLAEPDAPIGVSGPYRNRSLPGGAVLVPGERVSVRVVVENVGGTAGDYDVTLRAGGTQFDAAIGRLAAGESTTVELEGSAPTVPGLYELRAGDVATSVEVREPAAATVLGLSAAPSRPAPGEAVTVSVRVRNDHDWPAVREITLLVGDRTVDRWTVRLDAGEERTVRRTVAFDDPGRYVLRVGDADVQGATVGVGSRGHPAGAAIGLALLGGILACLVAVWLLAR